MTSEVLAATYTNADDVPLDDAERYVLKQTAEDTCRWWQFPHNRNAARSLGARGLVTIDDGKMLTGTALTQTGVALAASLWPHIAARLGVALPPAEQSESVNVLRERPNELQAAAASPPISPPPPTAGMRFDDGKVRLELIAPEWLQALGEVCTKGAVKYAARNWEKGMAHSKMIGCLLRHTLAYLSGERYDQETGCHHLAHAAWNALALMSYDVRGIGEADLPMVPRRPTQVNV